MLGKVNLPCGCEARKEIMFTQGNWTTTMTLAAAGIMVAVVAAYLLGRNPS
jgi:hypothetical protein